jgi:hypothetical protein
MTQLAAIELHTSNPDPKTFIRSIYVNLFSDLQTFQLALPTEMKKEFTKICTLLLDQSDTSTTDLIKKEIDYQKVKVRARITAPKTALVAMVSTTPIPMVQQGDLWQPVDDTVTFQRMNGSNVRQWPVIIKDGELRDTMYAARKDPENPRSFWKYFIITRDGAYVNCSKD